MASVGRVDVDRYAGTSERSPYDLVTLHNREYVRILDRVSEIFARRGLEARVIADLGCGTGNFTRAIAEALPASPPRRIEAIDANDAMLEVARAKAASMRTVHELVFRQGDLTRRETFPPESLDAINLIHTLHFIPGPRDVVASLASWLRPGGFFVVVDIGRELVVRNWARGLARWVYDDHRTAGASVPGAALRTAGFFLAARQAALQNGRFQQAQREGVYAMHSPEDFVQWFESVGLSVEEKSTAYVDPVTKTPISDLLVGVKPA